MQTEPETQPLEDHSIYEDHSKTKYAAQDAQLLAIVGTLWKHRATPSSDIPHCY